MTDRFDDAKRSLEGVPAPDLWAEAERRAADDGRVVPLAPVAGRVRRPGRWLTAAAGIVVAGVTVAVLANDDDSNLDTAPRGDDPGLVCGYASKAVVSPGASTAFTREVEPPPSIGHGELSYGDGAGPALHVYPFEIASPVDESIVIPDAEHSLIAIDRGDADLAFNASISRLSWQPEGAGPCETFSVTVSGAPGADTANALTDLANGITLTGPVGGEEVAIYQATDGACRLGISGEALPKPVTVSPTANIDGSAGTVVAGSLNATQTFEIQAPGQVVIDLVGERVEDAELRRGMGAIWLQADAVQVRWFTGSQEECESFTVTVSGGSEDENRHAAVDLAERVLMAYELPDAPTSDPNPLAGTEWQLESSTVDGEPTDGDGSVFSFTDTDLSWSDGCNDFSGPYSVDGDQLVVGDTSDVTSTALDCEATPTLEAVNAVMSASRIEWSIGPALGTLYLNLRAGDTELVLQGEPTGTGNPPADPTKKSPVPATLDTSTLIGTTWTISALSDGGEEVALPREGLVVSFHEDRMSWEDGCNQLNVPVDYLDGAIEAVGEVSTTLAACVNPAEGTHLIDAVLGGFGQFGSDPISLHMTSPAGTERLVLKRGDQAVVLTAP